MVGVDLNPSRLSVAKKRLPYYENLIGEKLAIRFSCVDVFELNLSNKFDFIWVHEAISHIDPAEKFIEFAHELLTHRGYLVICDAHALNPVVWFRAFKERRFDYHSTYRGQKYAVERVFPVWQMKNMLMERGFTVERITISSFLIPSVVLHIGHERAKKVETALNQIPLINLLGGVYTIVARKN